MHVWPSRDLSAGAGLAVQSSPLIRGGGCRVTRAVDDQFGTHRGANLERYSASCTGGDATGVTAQQLAKAYGTERNGEIGCGVCQLDRATSTLP